MLGRTSTNTYQNTVDYDMGLRQYMISVLNNMSVGVGISGLVAYLVGTNPALLSAIFGSTVMVWVVMLAPLVILFPLTWALSSLSYSVAKLWYYAFTASFGLSLSSIFLTFHLGSIVTVFLITMIMFSSLGLWGYTTKRDLTGFGSFLFMALIGLILVSFVGFWVHSSVFHFIINLAGVLIFAGFTCFDMQSIKNNYNGTSDPDLLARNALDGAINLYLDFLNLFINLLQILGPLLGNDD